jgi:hypothetical protein
MGKSDAAALYSKTVGRIEMRRLGRRTGSILVFLVSYLLSTVDTLPAAAPMTVSQLALYQGADREKVLIEGLFHASRFPYLVSNHRYEVREEIPVHQSF